VFEASEGELHSKSFELEISTHVEVIDEDPRSCWTIEGLGEWGWIMMGAEWVGGREAAMLTGGSAGIPAWWMAMVSLGMSLFFLCVQYPLMQKMYHRDTDDLLTEKQLRRLIQRILRKSTENLRIDIDFEKMKMQERAISIDVLIPYTTRSTTISEPIDIRAVLTRSLLEEFAVFGEMRPLQMRLMCADDGIYEAHESSRLSLKIGKEEQSSSGVIFSFPIFKDKRLDSCASYIPSSIHIRRICNGLISPNTANSSNKLRVNTARISIGSDIVVLRVVYGIKTSIEIARSCIFIFSKSMSIRRFSVDFRSIP
jgi:hypothetical protein